MFLLLVCYFEMQNCSGLSEHVNYCQVSEVEFDFKKTPDKRASTNNRIKPEINDSFGTTSPFHCEI